MELDIGDFLPKYPNIEQSKTSDLFNPYPDFYESLYKKKEFYDERLPEREKIPTVPGTQMKSQKIVSMFLSSFTMYDKVLLVHEMGTGKTCAVIGAIEQIFSEKTTIQKAFIFARGRTLLDNFMHELQFKCTGGQYIPEDYHELKSDRVRDNRTKLLTKKYELLTFGRFVNNNLRKIPDHILKEQYSNSIIVIDEVHNLRVKSGATSEDRDIYNEFHRFLHVVDNCKIVLMSGTPMKDQPSDIAGIMNLILPLDDQLPTDMAFVREYMLDTREGLVVNPAKLENLKSKFKGRVSYLRAMESDVEKRFMGTSVGDLEVFKVVVDRMSEFQTSGYLRAYAKDTEKRSKIDKKDPLDTDDVEGTAWMSSSRQAALFVYPDGTYGSQGFTQERYIRKKSKPQIGKKKAGFVYTMGSELREALQKDTLKPPSSSASPEDVKNVNMQNERIMLRNLYKYSSKYHDTVKNIITSYRSGKAGFVYCKLVEGSGLILFSLILEMFGFSKSVGKVTTEAPRFGIISRYTTENEAEDVIESFNSPANKHGQIISVMLGSHIIAEGFSFKNVQVENILTPHWNYSETAQAIARGIRLGSHKDLDNPEVEIYLRVSYIANGSPTIDLRLYTISEIKDREIKKMERILKESAFDCALMYERNYRPGNILVVEGSEVAENDDTRDCDYQSCKYTCDGVPMDIIENGLPDNKLEYTTYQLYYNMNRVNAIADEIVEMFRFTFKSNVDDVIDHFNDDTTFDIMSAIRKVINQNRPITNRYGYRSYLKEENNTLFLIDSLSVLSTYGSEYYSQFPNLICKDSFTNIVDKKYVAFLPNVVKQMCESSSKEFITSALTELPIDIQEFILETCILARLQNTGTGERFMNIILEHYKSFHKQVNGIWISWLMDEDNDGTGIRCLINGQWDNCSSEYRERVGYQREEIMTQLEQNRYGYYGTVNPDTDDFCIRDVQVDLNPDDARLLRPGLRCSSWTRLALINFLVNIFKKNPPNTDAVMLKTRDQLIAEMKGLRYAMELYAAKPKRKTKESSVIDEDRLKEAPDDELRRAVYWSGKKMSKNVLCKEIRKFFEDNNMIIENKGCGVQGDTKKPRVKKDAK